MPWLRIDDQFPDHPKVAQVGIEAAWLYICGLAYCSRYLTDGFVPDAIASGLIRGKSAAVTLKLASKLVAVGLWRKARDGFDVHDYLEYNPSRADVEAKREANKDRQSRHRNGKRNALHPESSQPSHSGSNGTPLSPSPNPEVLRDCVAGFTDASTGASRDVGDSDFSTAERHRLAHVLQGQPDPERCELCRVAP